VDTEAQFPLLSQAMSTLCWIACHARIKHSQLRCEKEWHGTGTQDQNLFSIGSKSLSTLLTSTLDLFPVPTALGRSMETYRILDDSVSKSNRWCTKISVLCVNKRPLRLVFMPAQELSGMM